jgi:YidC/Oxa1 family membrane protein insertase
MPDPNQSSEKKSIFGLDLKKELSMEMRLLLAFGLMGLVLLTTQYFMPATKPPLPRKAPVQEQVQTPPPQPAQPAPGTAAALPASTKAGKRAVQQAPAPVTIMAQQRETQIVETDVFRVELSNEGATVRSWKLKKYKDSDGKPVELTSAAGNAKAGWPFSYIFPGTRPAVDLDKALFSVKQPDPLTVEFEFSDGSVLARKTYRFDQKKYQVSISSDVAQGSQGISHLLSWRGGFGDRTAHNEAGQQHAVFFDGANNKLNTADSKTAKNGPVMHSGSFLFAGLEDNYFAAVVLPEPGVSFDFQVWQDSFKAKPDATEETAHVGTAVGGQPSLKMKLFIGPKNLDILRSTDQKLDQIIDWGWFWFIAKPLFLGLHWVNDNLTNSSRDSWGWAIIVITVMINFIMLPLRYTSMRSMNKMSAIKPQIDALNAKYKDVGMRDARKQKQNEELMALYSKHGINPMGGCIPILLQMPFFIAFYKVLSTAIELRGASWLWVSDLSSPEAAFIRVLPIGMLVTQVIMQKMTPTPGQDPSQKTMMMLMPIVLSVMFYSASSGLVLYWLTGNVVGIFQQYFFNKAAVSPVPAAPPARKKK